MITIVHGGQTGVDRGAHEAAINNHWHLAGYMPRDKRDERGSIPEDVACWLVPHETTSYAARTASNVHAAAAALIVVRDAKTPRVTPGTSATIDLAAARQLPRLIVDPLTDATQIARWIWTTLFTFNTLPLPLFEPPTNDPFGPAATRLLVAGPRESKWQEARSQTAMLLRQTSLALAEIAHSP